MENLTSKEKTVKNSIAGIFRVIILIPVTFLITPYMISKMGDQVYGLWSLGSVVTSFATLGDLGLGVALVKYTSEYNAKGDLNAINVILNTTIITFAFLGLLIIALLNYLSPFFIGTILRIPDNLIIQAKFLITGMSVVFFINITLGAFTYALEGLQRMDLSNSIKIISVLFQTFTTYLALENGWGIVGLIIGNSFAVILTGILSLLYLKKIFPILHLHPKFFNFKVLKSTLSYSLQIQLANFITLGFDPFIRSAISNISSLSFVSFYDVANKITAQIKSIIVVAMNPIMPVSAEIALKNDKSELVKFHNNIFVILIAFGTIVYLLPVGLISGFVKLWLGNNYFDVSKTFQILMIGWYCSMLSTPSFIIFRGCGKPKYTVYTQIILVSSNIILGIIFGHFWGYYGILYATATALILASLYLIIQFQLFTGGAFSKFPIKKCFLVFIIGAIITYLSSISYYRILPQGYVSLLLISVVSIITYFSLIFLLKIIQWNQFISTISNIFKKKQLLKSS